nr:unnamed protein product [Callosobruchus chinensis]
MDSYFDFTSVVKPNIVALKLLGFWRSSREKSVFNTIWYRIYTAVVILLQVIFEGTGFLYLYDKWECLSLVDITSVIFIYSTGVVNLAMCLHFIQSTMKSEMFRPKSQSQTEDAKKWKRVARRFQKLFFANNITLNVAAIFLGIWRDEKYILMCATYVSLITSLLVEIIIQLCLLETTLETVEDGEGIERCVKWHLQILVFVKKVQRLCGSGVFGVLFCGVINICTSLSLLTESEKISSAIYNSQWINADVSHKKKINIYMLLTQKPLHIYLGGGITTASLPVFVTVIKFTVSSANKRYKSYTATVVFLQLIMEATGFLYLYDKWECISLVDINSVLFIYSTGLTNVAMMILTLFNIGCLHFIQLTMKSSMFQPKTKAQAEDANQWKSVARSFQKLFFGNNILLNIAVVVMGIWKDNELILVAHKPSILQRKVFVAFQAAMCIYSAQMCATYVSLITSLLVEIIIQLCLLEKTLETLRDAEGIRQCVEWHLQILVGGVELLFLLPYLVEIIMIIYSHCWCGSELLYQSGKISSAIYSSHWTSADLSHKKKINIYMLLTQKPLQIYLGGGITTASLPVFVTVIKLNFLCTTKEKTSPMI